MALVAAALLAGGAEAGPCGDTVAQIAQAHGLAVSMPEAQLPKAESTPPEPPATVESRGLLGTDNVEPPLAQSGGPIEPPDVGRTPVIQPPPVGDDMPTAPEIRAGNGERSQQEKAAEQLRAASLLTAAREADEAGQEQMCRQRLAEARKYLTE